MKCSHVSDQLIGSQRSIRPNRMINSNPSQNVGSDYGALMTQENLGFKLWVYFPRNTLPAMVAAGLIPGFRFLSAFFRRATVRVAVRIRA